MAMYESFARVYDTFMDNVPYEEWFARLHTLLTGYGIRDGLVLDLGCGTGKMTRLFAGAGYDMIGVDQSPEMLQIAREHDLVEEDVSKPAFQDIGIPGNAACVDAPDILYLLQDMRGFELYGTVRAVVCVCDCINYVTDPEELVTVFSLVNNYLDPGGIFLFDFNPVYKYRELLGDTTIAEAREDCSFIWENTWYEEERMNEYDLTLFLKEEGTRYRRFDEVHYQRGYTLKEIKTALQKAGLRFEAAFDAYTDAPAHEMSERVLVAAREQGKGNTDM